MLQPCHLMDLVVHPLQRCSFQTISSEAVVWKKPAEKMAMNHVGKEVASPAHHHHRLFVEVSYQDLNRHLLRIRLLFSYSQEKSRPQVKLRDTNPYHRLL